MRIRPFIVTLLGVVISSTAVFLAKEQLLDVKGAAIAAQDMEFVNLVVARNDIDFGQPIDPQSVTTQKWPREAMPSGAFTDLAALTGGQGTDFRRAKGRLFAGEVILASKVSDFGEKVTIVQKLGTNTRAMAIKVDAVTAVGGFVTPGDFVDIVLTEGNSGAMRAVTILQNIRVIGVDQTSEESRDTPEIARTITVEVTPDQGQRLALAQRAGSLSLTLRTLENVEDKPLDMVDLRDLLQEKSPVPEPEKKPSITVRRGNVVEVVEMN